MRDDATVMKRRKSIPLVSELVSSPFLVCLKISGNCQIIMDMFNENKRLNFILELLFPKYNIHQLEYAIMTRLKEYICSISAIMIDDLCIMMFLASIQYDNAFIWV